MALRGEGSSRVSRDLLRRTNRSDLRIRPGDGESLPAICFGLDVQHILAGARVGDNHASLTVHQSHVCVANVARAFDGTVVGKDGGGSGAQNKVVRVV